MSKILGYKSSTSNTACHIRLSTALSLNKTMKLFITCLFLFTTGLAYAGPFPKDYFNSLKQQDNEDKFTALLQSLDRTEDDQEDDDDDDLADIQGVFNVLAQVEMERAKGLNDKSATAQFWGILGNALWKAGKGYLKKKYCTEEQEVRAMLQDLISEQEIPEDDDDDDAGGDALAELQTLFNALKNVEAKMMQDGMTDKNAEAEGWWKKVRRWAKKKVKHSTKKYLC